MKKGKILHQISLSNTGLSWCKILSISICKCKIFPLFFFGKKKGKQINTFFFSTSLLIQIFHHQKNKKIQITIPNINSFLFLFLLFSINTNFLLKKKHTHTQITNRKHKSQTLKKSKSKIWVFCSEPPLFFKP